MGSDIVAKLESLKFLRFSLAMTSIKGNPGAIHLYALDRQLGNPTTLNT